MIFFVLFIVFDLLIGKVSSLLVIQFLPPRIVIIPMSDPCLIILLVEDLLIPDLLSKLNSCIDIVAVEVDIILAPFLIGVLIEKRIDLILVLQKLLVLRVHDPMLALRILVEHKSLIDRYLIISTITGVGIV